MMQAVLMYKSLINLHDSGSYTHTGRGGGGERRERQAGNKGGVGGERGGGGGRGEKWTRKACLQQLVFNSLQLRSGLSFHS